MKKETKEVIRAILHTLTFICIFWVWYNNTSYDKIIEEVIQIKVLCLAIVIQLFALNLGGK